MDKESLINLIKLFSINEKVVELLSTQFSDDELYFIVTNILPHEYLEAVNNNYSKDVIININELDKKCKTLLSPYGGAGPFYLFKSSTDYLNLPNDILVYKRFNNLAFKNNDIEFKSKLIKNNLNIDESNSLFNKLINMKCYSIKLLYRKLFKDDNSILFNKIEKMHIQKQEYKKKFGSDSESDSKSDSESDSESDSKDIKINDIYLNTLPDKNVNILQTKTSEALGSNEGGIYLGSDNIRRYIKKYKELSQAYCEFIANSLYKDLNIITPRCYIYKINNEYYFASEMIELGKFELTKKYCKKVVKGFISDILLANWDVIGLSYDNISITRNGDIIRIDNGSTFMFRAQGDRKPDDDLYKISEWNQFLSNNTYANIFKKLNTDDPCMFNKIFKKQMEKIKSLSIYGWNKYIDNLIIKDIPLNDNDKNIMIKMLTERESLLEKQLEQCEKVLEYRNWVTTWCEGNYTLQDRKIYNIPENVEKILKSQNLPDKIMLYRGYKFENIDKLNTWFNNEVVTLKDYNVNENIKLKIPFISSWTSNIKIAKNFSMDEYGIIFSAEMTKKDIIGQPCLETHFEEEKEYLLYPNIFNCKIVVIKIDGKEINNTQFWIKREISI